MDSTSCSKLKQDVWRYIFEEILEESIEECDSADVILPLLLVCKEWKVIALPLLYRYLRFHEPTSITKCQRTLVQQGIRGAYPGNSTRCIRLLVGTSWPDNTVPRLEKLLRYTPRLKVFYAPMLPVGTDILDTLGEACGPLLKRLDIAIGGNSTEATLQVALLTRFTSLVQLDIHLLDMAQIHTPDTPALDMPSLQILSLSCYTDEPLSALVHFLCRSSFAALDTLTLTIRDSAGLPLGRTPCETILPLLETFGHQLSVLTLHVPQSEDVARLLFPPLKAVIRIELFSTPPNDIGRFLPESLQLLRLAIDFEDRTQLQDLLQCLENLRDMEPKTDALKVVFLQSWTTNERFRWSTIGTLNPALAGHLMTRSIWLQSKGIKLVDGAGSCMTWSAR
ncbi:hypothetical protein CALVIDRAFT_136393 [Calocera viscosa TUFC12733]|uniref:F-box domain-containing protein n=1 Tax=Calocera viscosa (strain TUFC12733) TaxID=1330018 RepID=A0A167LYC9_CALVF|nr:hypothetical protein CALVIDRAFT_136393 [Calocera viscosa TUFC12733]